ncbi:class I SAM-dependent methyltransferase [Rhodocyclaceae bacterium SMB388]
MTPAASAHAELGEPSRWVTRFAPLICASGTVLDYACGGGRHARFLAAAGRKVVAVDRDAGALAGLNGIDRVRPLELDLEGEDWPLAGLRVDAIVVTNYLHRPRFSQLLDLLEEGGVLIYETFMRGNERFGRPRSPEFLLEPGELLERVGKAFSIVAFEQGEIGDPPTAVVQRVCAVKGRHRTVRLP